jgi:hypothetical protein
MLWEIEREWENGWGRLERIFFQSSKKLLKRWNYWNFLTVPFIDVKK